MINTDPKRIEEFLTRGVENIFPYKEYLQKQLQSGKKLKMYLGIDPTGPTLHLGHAIPIRKLSEFQKLGHEVILLIGDFTAMIGDPTDKAAVRKQLTRKEVLNNSRLYKKQASKFLKFSSGGAKLKYNSKWLAKMKFADVLNLASNMTVQQMLERDMFKKRFNFTTQCPNCGEINLWLHANFNENTSEFSSEEKGSQITGKDIHCIKCGLIFNPSNVSHSPVKVFGPKPIYLHEFLYPLMQGYDSVAMDVDGEIGGNDQTFNMLTGRNLMERISHKEKFVITLKLLQDSSGIKMGKTENNSISMLDNEFEMFGKVMSWTDGMIIPAFEICTDVPLSEISKIVKDLEGGANPRDAKVRLAKEIVGIYHSKAAADKAERNFIDTFKKGGLPDNIEEITARVVDQVMSELLVSKNIVESKSDFRRLVAEGAVSDAVSGEKIIDPNYKIEKDITLKIGKKRFVKISI